jgi:hypothetical protein
VTTPLVSRAAAGLKPPRRPAPAIDSEGLTAHYGGDSPWGSSVDRSSEARFQATANHARCASIWRAWQAFHMAPVAAGGRGWNDIAYNSGVCPHGYRYEGRGPGVRSGANGTNDGNRRSEATCYIAGAGDPLTDSARRAYIDEGDRLSELWRQHGDWKPTACAGAAIRAWKATGWAAPGSPTPPPKPDDPEVYDMRPTLSWLRATPDAAYGDLYLVDGATATWVAGGKAEEVALVRVRSSGGDYDSSTKTKPHSFDFNRQVTILDGPAASTPKELP